MNKTISQLFAVVLSFASSVTFANKDNLCDLPEGTMTKKWIIVDDKSSQTTERYDIKLDVEKGKAPVGNVVIYDLLMNKDTTLESVPKANFHFTLSGCTPSNPVFTVNSTGLTSVGGYLRIHDVNKTMGEVTLTGAIQTYSDDLLGMMSQWATETLWDALGYDNIPEVDIRRRPVRLK
ncbi:hypothetical protein [Endozoicomonas montiporae]|nr:hypothetical protein [Endozoicomonas montiporae]AMO58786.1 hypothetical protein EZMO1_4896 [Endozoicomonas montiporae CL-33]